MPPRLITLQKENYYHIYNRGVNRGLIFFSDRNYLYFVNKLSFFFEAKALVLAYCLLPNHFHLLVKVTSDDFVNKALHPLFVSYAKSVNIEQNRSGPLFQGRYQVNPVEDENYLLDCTKYIHLNPVKAGLVNLPEKWKYSSYAAYLSGERDTFVDTSVVLNYFDSTGDFREFSELGIDQYESKYFHE